MAMEISTPVEELSGGSMVGTLDTWPLTDILVWLHENRRTAMLRIGDGLDAGVVFYREGHLYRAEWGRMMGEEALTTLLGTESGSFSLMLRDIADARPNIRLETHEVLLRLATSCRHRSTTLIDPPPADRSRGPLCCCP